MAEYRLYRFEGGHIRSVVVLDGEDDHDVVARCESTVADGVYELWQSARMVKRFEPADGAD
jgi:hypothetical protein